MFIGKNEGKRVFPFWYSAQSLRFMKLFLFMLYIFSTDYFLLFAVWHYCSEFRLLVYSFRFVSLKFSIGCCLYACGQMRSIRFSWKFHLPAVVRTSQLCDNRISYDCYAHHYLLFSGFGITTYISYAMSGPTMMILISYLNAGIMCLVSSHDCYILAF